MDSIRVDKTSCISCALCVKVCPRGLIAMGKDGTPLGILGFKSLCVKCGHCVSACPKAALSIPSMSPADCIPLNEDGKATPEQIAKFLRSRRSTRLFKKEPLPKETLEKILSIAACAPTGLNTRSLSWTVFAKPAEVHEIASMTIDWMRKTLKENPQLGAAFGMDKISQAWDNGKDPILRGAPHLFVAHAKSEDSIAVGSAFIALAYLELAAHSLSLGACWAGYFHFASGQYPPLKEFLSLPDGHVCLGGMMIGSSDVNYKRIPARPPLPVRWR